MKLNPRHTETSTLFKTGTNSYDWMLFFAMIILVSFGILMIYSTSFSTGQLLSNLYIRQIVYALLGLGGFIAVSRLDYKIFAQLSWFLYFLALILLVVTFVWGISTRGSTRWIDFGWIRLQPTEVMKPVLIAVLALYYSTQEKINLKAFLVGFMLAVIPALLVFRQPDLGSAVILMGIWLLMTLVSGASWKYLFGFALVLILVLPVGFNSLHDYQKSRLTTFINPSSDPQGSGYNIIQSIIAVGSGQVTGRGFGRGTQSHLNFLPEQQTDFIFATMAEELGFVGVSIVLTIFLILVVRVVKIAQSAPDQFSFLLVIGVLSMLLLQLLINVGMNIGILPVTGITLPFISFGGSSLVALMISLGLVESIARYRKKSVIEVK